MNLKEKYNITEASDFLNVSRVTFYKIIKRYKLKPIEKISTMNLFSIGDLLRVKKDLNGL